VFVIGFMREFIDIDDIVRVDQFDLVSWIGGGRDYYVWIMFVCVIGWCI